MKSQKIFVLLVIAVVVVIGGMSISHSFVQAQSKNTRTLIQSLIDGKKLFAVGSISDGGRTIPVDGTKVLVSDLGDDYVCLSGSGLPAVLKEMNVGTGIENFCFNFATLLINY